MEFLQANWIWIVLAVGVGVLLFRRGGTGCGTGDHGTKGSDDASAEASERPPLTGAGGKRGGCC